MSEYIIEKTNKLSLKGMTKLLPRIYKPFLEVRRLRRIPCVKCSKGWIALYSVKDYNDMPKWRVKPFENNSDVNIAYWAFGLDLKGLLIIPSDIVRDFCNTNTVSKTPSGKWKLGIHDFDGRYFLCSQDSRQDVTEYLLPPKWIMKLLEKERSGIDNEPESGKNMTDVL